MTLFNNTAIDNLLPYDGTVQYFGKIIQQTEADRYLNILLNNIEWKNDEAIIFGRHIITARKVAWYGDEEYSYTYSKITKTALRWTKELLELKEIVEPLAGTTFNSCLLNLYHNGDEGMAWHSDDEKALQKNGAIASFSFGSERKFSFKHKTSGLTTSLVLEHGSLLIMKDATQTNWLHRLPPTKKVNTPRVNLTFRKMLV